jgi:hypothetical protein
MTPAAARVTGRRGSDESADVGVDAGERQGRRCHHKRNQRLLRSRHRTTVVDKVEVMAKSWEQCRLPSERAGRGGRRAALGTDPPSLDRCGWSRETTVLSLSLDPPGLDRKGASRGTERRTRPRVMIAGLFSASSCKTSDEYRGCSTPEGRATEAEAATELEAVAIGSEAAMVKWAGRRARGGAVAGRKGSSAEGCRGGNARRWERRRRRHEDTLVAWNKGGSRKGKVSEKNRPGLSNTM